MKIDLNAFAFDADFIPHDIFKYIEQERIYSHYMNEDIREGIKTHSPFREDNIPSFSFYSHKNMSNILMFHDFAVGLSGDAIRFVAILYNISYMEASLVIIDQFDLGGQALTNMKRQNIIYSRVVQKEQVSLEVKTREWTLRDKNFWAQFGVLRKSTLKRFNVYPISHIIFNENIVKADEYAYCYVEYKDGKTTLKIYQPFSEDFKWINNANYSVHQGYELLPPTGELLIITKSLKDVMSLYDTADINATGLQSESVMMKDSVMDEYKQRFKHVLCLFDNDKAGKTLSKKFSETFQVPYFFVPELTNVTDYSDLVKKGGVERASNFIKKKINEIKHKYT